jgi:hypothetical protein
MTAQILIPARAASIQIDFQMAQSILDRLGYTLRDLSLEYGDVVIPHDDITHELHYPSHHNSHNIAGYIYCDNGIYYTSGEHWNNHRQPECAALDLLDRAVVEDCRYTIDLERAASDMPDYD